MEQLTTLITLENIWNCVDNKIFEINGGGIAGPIKRLMAYV